MQDKKEKQKVPFGFRGSSVAALLAEVNIVPQTDLPRREESNFLRKLLCAAGVA